MAERNRHDAVIRSLKGGVISGLFVFCLCAAWPATGGGTNLPGWSDWTEDFEWSFRALGFYTFQEAAASTQNPGNFFLQLPSHQATAELRPDLALDLDRLHLSAKPRLRLNRREVKTTFDRQNNTHSEWFVNEWLARAGLTNSLFASIGRENLQWGPSYLISPSNPYFQDNGRANPKQEVAGMDFARLVWLPHEQWTVSVLANIDKGKQKFPVRDFKKTYGAKIDYSGPESYASLILSHRSSGRNRIGGYFGRTLTDALIVYAETGAAKGSDAFYPVKAANPIQGEMVARKDNSSIEAMALAGGAYTLSAGPTLTLEYVHNTFGYTDDEANRYYRLRKNANDTFTGPLYGLSRLTLGRTADPGLRLLRRNYLMAQVMHRDMGNVLDVTFRATWNMDDGSCRLISMIEYFFNDFIQFFSIGTVNTGGSEAEFGSMVDLQWIFGVEYAW